MSRAPLALSLIVSLVAACGAVSPTPRSSPAPPEPTPMATPVSSPSPPKTLPPTASPTATPSATPGSPPPPSATPQPQVALEGVWVSGRITRDMIRAALRAHGFDPAGLDDIVNSRAFVDYIVYELTIDRTNWTEMEVPDGLPWATGWQGTYIRPDADTVIATDSSNRCNVTLASGGSAQQLGVAVRDDSCGTPDLLAQIAVYEAAGFHRVDGAGALQPTLQPAATPVPVAPFASTSHSRLTARPIGTVDGANLGYLEYLPPGYADGVPRPLLIALHGSGQSGPGTAASLLNLYEVGIPPLIRQDRWPDSRPFVVLAPQHNIQAPEVCITPTELADFLSFAVGHYRVDPARVYLTGLSCGAIGSWNYLATDAATIAAAVLISGGGYGAIDQAGCDLGRVPVWAFHGMQDDVVPVRYDVYTLASIQHCVDPPPVDARLTLYPDAGHDAWTRTYDLSAGYDVYAWLLQYPK